MAALNWFRFASPASFFPLAGTLTRICAWIAGILAIAGLYVGFVIAPTDFQQGESYRIIFIHVPAAWMAMFESSMIVSSAKATSGAPARSSHAAHS